MCVFVSVVYSLCGTHCVRLGLLLCKCIPITHMSVLCVINGPKMDLCSFLCLKTLKVSAYVICV